MHGSVKVTVGAAGALVLIGLAAGCSSGSSSTSAAAASARAASAGASAQSASTGATAGMAGNEVFSGTEQLTKAQAGSSKYVPVIPLHATGVFADTGSIALVPGSGANGNGPGKAALKLSKGSISVTHGADSNPNARPSQLAGTCMYEQAEHTGYTVTGGTKAYAGVTGHGTATIIFRFTLPKLADGKCSTAANAAPAGASVTFLATGPLTLP